MLNLLLLLLAAPEPVVLTYTGQPGGPVVDFQLTAHAPGAKVRIASDRARLRDAPSTSGVVVAELALGDRVEVVERSKERARVDERVDHWYRVQVPAPGGAPARTGYLFGAALSPAVFEADLDGDGEVELASVSWTWGFKIKVRVMEPGIAAPSRETVLELQPAGQAYACCGGNLEVELIPAEEAGIALVSIASSVEACGDNGKVWVSYRSPARTKLGVLEQALSLGGLSDPPSHSTFSVRFDARAKTAEVTRETWEDGDDGAKTGLETSKVRHVLRGGVFAELPAAK